MRRLVPLLVLAAMLGGCGSDEPERQPAQASPDAPAATPSRAHVPRPGAAVRCLAGSTRSYAHRGVAAVLHRATNARARPGGPVVARFGRLNLNGVETTFRVLEARVGADCRPTWYRVQLPIRPNGAQGWIDASAARRYAVDFRILVDLSERRVTVYRGDELLVETPAAIGRPETPTPIGHYYVNQRLLAADPSGPWGPGGIGISAFSPVLTGWAQGGPIAIHGTNRPETIGHAASNGCLRIDNRLLGELIQLVPDGTPVRIRT